MSFVSNFFSGQSLRGGMPQIPTAGELGAPQAAPVQQAAAGGSSSSGFSIPAKYRTMIIIAASIFFIMVFVVVENWLDDAFGRKGRKQGNVVFVDQDPVLPPETRNVDDARSSAGFLAQIFCRGGKRSKYCY